jgi:hypothetical protein
MMKTSGFALLDLIKNGDKKYTLSKDALKEALNNTSEEPVSNNVGNTGLQYLPLIYHADSNGSFEYLRIVPVKSNQETTSHKYGPKTDYTALSIVSGPSIDSIEGLIQEKDTRTGLPKVLTHNYIVAEGDGASKAFDEILKQAKELYTDLKKPVSERKNPDLGINTTQGLYEIIAPHISKCYSGKHIQRPFAVN